jgi:hypothetical protein
MSDITISVGTVMSVAVGAPAAYTTAGYEALSWTEVGEVANVPAFGGSATVTEFIPIATGVVNKKKGSINYGDITVPMAQRLDDSGQAVLKSGFDGANRRQTHSFKLANPEIGVVYFTAEISGYTYNYGDANAITQNEVSLAIKTQPIVDADVFSVTYAAGANGAVYGDLEQTVLSGGSTTAVFAAPLNDATHVFSAWSDASTDNPRTDTNVTADINVTANFTVI